MIVNLKLDDTTATGALGVADFDSKALRFDLNVDRINADRYLPPPTEEPAQARARSPPTEIPVDALRNLNARGQLRVGEAIFAGIKFTKLRLGVNARDGKVRLNPSEASMYGGQYRGDIGIDATSQAARVTLDEHVSGIDFAPLFKDLFETDRVSGKGSANIKLAGTGRNTDDLDEHARPALSTSTSPTARWKVPTCGTRFDVPAPLLKQQAVPEREAARAHDLQRAQGHRRHEGRRADEQ